MPGECETVSIMSLVNPDWQDTAFNEEAQPMNRLGFLA
jgi:hypothetical protein